MEASAAISLTGNIIQFVDTAISLVTTARQLRESGSTAEHKELAFPIHELRALVNRVTSAPASTFGAASTQLDDEPHDEPLNLLCSQCEEVTTELLNLLVGIDIGNDTGRLETALAVLRSRWKKVEIEPLQGRLDRISRAVHLHLGLYDRRMIFARIEILAAGNRRLETRRVQTSSNSSRTSSAKSSRGWLGTDAGPRPSYSMLLQRDCRFPPSMRYYNSCAKKVWISARIFMRRISKRSIGCLASPSRGAVPPLRVGSRLKKNYIGCQGSQARGNPPS